MEYLLWWDHVRQWSDREMQDCINLLELKAASYGFKCFAVDKKNSEISFRIDNIISSQNIETCRELRMRSKETEWSLATFAFKELIYRFGQSKVEFCLQQILTLNARISYIGFSTRKL